MVNRASTLAAIAGLLIVAMCTVGEGEAKLRAMRVKGRGRGVTGCRGWANAGTKGSGGCRLPWDRTWPNNRDYDYATGEVNNDKGELGVVGICKGRP